MQHNFSFDILPPAYSDTLHHILIDLHLVQKFSHAGYLPIINFLYCPTVVISITQLTSGMSRRYWAKKKEHL